MSKGGNAWWVLIAITVVLLGACSWAGAGGDGAGADSGDSPEVDGSCGVDFSCDAGSYCDAGSGTCVEYLQSGEACNDSSQCLSGSCLSGQCQ